MRVVVIGSGLLGLSTAYFLRRSGMEVVILDRASAPAQEASFANGGLLTSGMAEPWNAPGVVGHLVRSIGRPNAPLLVRAHAVPSLLGWGLKFLRESSPQRYDVNTLKNVRLALYSQAALRQLQDDANVSCSYVNCGSLKVFRDAAALQACNRRAEWLQGHGVPSQRMNAREILDLEPMLADIRARMAGGIYYPNDSVGDARQFCEGLAVALRNAGAEFRFCTPVLGWKREGERIQAAVTTQGLIFADAFVLAAANANRDLTRSLGFDVPIRPVKGYSITVPGTSLPAVPRLPVIDDELHAVVVPLGKQLRVAGTAEFAGSNLDISPARIENLRRLLVDIYPRADVEKGCAALNPWTAARALSVDGVPILGVTPASNLYINTGHGHLGWTLAAGSGKAVAELLAGLTPAIAMSDYSLNRF